MPVALQRVFKSIIRLTGTIPSGDTLDFDIMPYSTFDAVEYLIKIKRQSSDLVKALTLVGSKKNSDVSDQIYSKVGEEINVDANFLKDGTDTKLRLVNNESFDVDVSILKFLF